jgi:hypothetical protein
MVEANTCHANSSMSRPAGHKQFGKLMDASGYCWLAWNEYPF